MADLATLAVKVDLTELASLTKKLEDVVDKAGKSEKSTKSLTTATSALSVAAKAGAVAFTALSAGATASILTFSDLETRLVAVQKTTDFTATEMEQFKGIVSDLSKELPVSTAALYDIAGAAGQLGIKGVENISQFTETMGKLSLATDIVGDQGTQDVARLLNVLGEGPETVSQFGNVLVALGNNSAATESQILSLATEVGQATSTFAVNSAEAAAMGAAMASLGVSSELGGSVVGRAMRAMEDAINEGGVAAQNLSSITGVATEDLKEQFGENTTNLFVKFVSGLGNVVDVGTSAKDALEKFGLSGEEVLKVLPTLAENSDVLEKSLKIANDQLERGSALDDEVAKASTTLASQWQILKNITADYAFAIGEDLAPNIKDLIDSIMDWEAAYGDIAKFEIGIAIDAASEAVAYLWDVITQADDVVTAAFGLIAMETEKLEKNFDIATTSIKYSFALAFDGVTELAADLAEDISGTLGKIPVIGEELASGLAETAAGYEKSSTAAEDFKAELAGIEEKYQGNVAAIEATVAATLLQESASNTATEAEKSHATAAVTAQREIKKETEGTTDRVIKLADDTTKAKSKALKEQEEEAKRVAEKQADLEKDLNEKILELTASELEVKLAALDSEVEAAMETAGTRTDLIDKIWEYYEAANKDIIEAEKEKSEEIEDINKDLTDKVNELKMDELDYNLWKLDEEIKEYEEYAKKDKEIADQIAAYRKLKTAEILEDYKDTTWKIYGIEVDYAQLTEDTNQALVDAFIAGEDAKVAAASVASGYLSDYAVDAATKALEPIVAGIGEQVAAWVTLGEAQTVTEGDTWSEKIANGAGYLAAATAAVLAAMAIEGNFATGGWIGANPNGGIINSGSGMIDDVLLGYTNGGKTRNMGMGGEFVINKETTQKNLPFLFWLNSQREKVFADGGPVSDPSEIASGLASSGFGAAGEHLVATAGWDWAGAAGEAMTYFGTAAASIVGGKAAAEAIFAEGGPSSTPLTFEGISDDERDAVHKYVEERAADDDSWEDELVDTLLDAGSDVLGLFGDLLAPLTGLLDWEAIWDFIKDLPIVGSFLESIEKMITPFSEAALTPGETPSADDMTEGVWDAFSDFGDNLLDSISDLIGLRNGGLLGSYETGTNFVPITGPYLLHQGEAVIPAAQNTANIADQAEIKKVLAEISRYARITAELLKKFDGDGLPAERLP